MLNRKVEKAVFAIIFLVLYLIIGNISTNIKINNLEINKGKSPEQIIEEEYPDLKKSDLQYKYIINGDFLFVCMETKTGYCQLDFARRTRNSGYFFKVPGLSFGPNYNIKYGTVNLGEDKLLNYYVYKIQSKYVIEIADLFGKRSIEVYNNQDKIGALSLDNALNQYWAVVLNDLDILQDITCIYGNNEIHIIDNEEVKLLYGVN
jgi:hypothetical protein